MEWEVGLDEPEAQPGLGRTPGEGRGDIQVPPMNGESGNLVFDSDRSDRKENMAK